MLWHMLAVDFMVPIVLSQVRAHGMFDGTF